MNIAPLTSHPASVAAKLAKPRDLQISQSEIDDAVTEIARFVGRCRARGGTVCFQLPPIPEDSFDKSREVVIAVQSAVQQVPGLISLNGVRETVYPKDPFFDTYYHLRKARSERRSRELVNALRRHGLVRWRSKNQVRRVSCYPVITPCE